MRKTGLQCDFSDGFSELKDLSLPDNTVSLETVTNIRECQLVCARNCSCSGYAFDGGSCSIWNEELVNIQSGFGKNLYLKLPVSELINNASKNLRQF